MLTLGAVIGLKYKTTNIISTNGQGDVNNVFVLIKTRDLKINYEQELIFFLSTIRNLQYVP